MIRGVVIALVLGGCLISTIIQLPTWRDDRALWTEAASLTDLPRPALNLATLALKDGDVGRALAWDTDALRRVTWAPSEALAVRTLVQSHIRWILATSRSTDICRSGPWVSWCPSS